MFYRKFYKKYGSPGKINLLDTSHQFTLCQLFVKEYERLQAEGIIPEDQLFEETALALEAQGIYLDRSRAPPKVGDNPVSWTTNLFNFVYMHIYIYIWM